MRPVTCPCVWIKGLTQSQTQEASLGWGTWPDLSVKFYIVAVFLSGDKYFHRTVEKISSCFQAVTAGSYSAEEDKRKCYLTYLKDVSWIPAKRLVLKRFGMLWIVRGSVCESGDLMEEGSVKYKRETCSDKNSPREPEILIIQTWEPLILDQCWRLLEPLLTVTYRVCRVHDFVAFM